MSNTEKLLEFQFPAKAEALCQMRDKLRETIRPCCKSDEFFNCIVLAIGEACMNIIQHAYSKDDAGDIIIRIEKSQSSMTVHLTDFAHRKSCKEEMMSRPLHEIRPGGLGCHIINEIMDDVRLIECNDGVCGNVLRMKKSLKN